MSGLRSFEENHVCWCLENKKGNISELIYKYNPIQSFMYLYSSHFYHYILIFICDNILSYVWQAFTIGILYELKSYLAGHILCLAFVTWLELLCVLLNIFYLHSYLAWHFSQRVTFFYVRKFSYFQIKFTLFFSISLWSILKTQILKSGLANLEEIGLMSIKLFYVDIFIIFFCLFPLHDII